jgi:DNA polymerase-3 subunit epsilon
METVAVLEFETTGLSPNMGDRATEIAITLVRDGQVVDRFQSLMNAGRWIPGEVTALTGITNGLRNVNHALLANLQKVPRAQVRSHLQACV